MIITNYFDDGSAITGSGDSGGPVTFRQNGTTPTVFGTLTGNYSPLVGHDVKLHSPTFANGNGAWINQYLLDADHDGVDDSIDNCAPRNIPQCAIDLQYCYNPDQADLDSDGVGDTCDNCAPSICATRGWPVASCSNTNQFDQDEDLVGDECDSCPTVRNPDGQGGDSDGDGVGDACDNCSQPNGFSQCETDSDCQVCTTPGNCTHLGECVSIGQQGFCASGPNINKACGSSLDCDGATCSPPVTNGRCTIQLDDFDRDGVGGACDSCPYVYNVSRQANSNDVAETFEGVAAGGDVCDPVPLLVSRAIIGTGPLPGGTPGDFGSTATTTAFFTTAGLGVGMLPDQSDSLETQGTFTAGFRYCTCLRNGVQLSSDACRLSQCLPLDTAYSAPSATANWVPITVGTSGALTAPSAGDTLTPGGEVIRLFTSDVTCDDTFTHPNVTSETCRVGAKQEFVVWYDDVDMQANRVPRQFPGEDVQAGIFWSHVVRDATHAQFTSIRDADNPLRNSYEYVTTPLDLGVLFPPEIFFPIQVVGCAVQNNCHPYLIPDVPPTEAPITSLSTYVASPSSLQQVSALSRLVPGPNSSVIAVAGSAQKQVDTTASLSPGTIALLGQTNVSWLHPQETGARLRQAANGAPAMVAMPMPWRQSYGQPTALVESGGELMTLGETKKPSALPAGAPGSPFVPGDRDGARAVFSGTESAVYLVGGTRPDGNLTRQVWQYSFAQSSWSELFVPNAIGVEFPQTIRALAYDDQTRRMVVIDDAVEASSAQGGDNRRTTRLLVLDTSTQRTQVVSTFARSGRLSHVGLVAQDDGSFLLVGQIEGVPAWIDYRFTIDPTTNNVSWTGISGGEGDVLDDPVRTTPGVYLPVYQHGRQEIVSLSSAAFVGHDSCDDL